MKQIAELFDRLDNLDAKISQIQNEVNSLKQNFGSIESRSTEQNAINDYVRYIKEYQKGDSDLGKIHTHELYGGIFTTKLN